MKNSVVLTTYNGEKFITEQLDSIRHQTLQPDEVIIRDDYSTDHTPLIIRKYICEHRLNWDFRENKQNKGFYFNFIDAIRESTGNIIYLADQDDIWDLQKIEAFSACYEEHPEISMIQSNFRFIDGEGNSVPRKEFYHGKKPSNELIFLDTIDMFKFAGSGFTMSFRKTVSDKVFEKGLEKRKKIFVFHDLLLGQMATILGDCYLMTKIVDAHRLHSSNETQRDGRSYIAGRTKQMQLEILERRCEQCNQMKSVASSREIGDIEKIRSFTIKRIELISKRNVKIIKELVRDRNLYMSKRGLITDIMYAIGMEKVLLQLYKRM